MKKENKMKKLEKIDALSIKEIELVDLDLKEIGGFEKISLKTTGVIEDLPLQSDSLNEFYEPLVRYNGKYDRKANNFTSDAKKKYIDADKEFYKKTKANMTINSGTRTVKRQAELYVLYKWHNQGNPASWPGCSYHNWGVAADMIRTDESNVVSAMKEGGWTRTVDDEGWHFECTSSPDHKKASTKIASFRKKGSGLAYKWSEQVAHFYLKSRDFNKRAPTFNRRLEAHRQNGQVLQNDIDKFNQDISRLKSRANKYNQDANHFNNELARANRMVDEINNMPGGPARDRKIREFRRLESWLSSESSRLNRESASIDRENDRLSRESSSLDVRITAFKREDDWLNKEYKSLSKIEAEIPKHQTNANNLLGKIESAVG